MYKAFYGLQRKPFSILPDPDFLYWASPHSLAFSMLEYGVLSQAGFTVITGEIGAGKTTLIQHLLSIMPADLNVGLVSNTQSDRGDLLLWLMTALGLECEEQSYVGQFRKFEHFLKQQYDGGRRTVVIVDEAQNLGVKDLEELRMTSNLNVRGAELLQFILVGQPQLQKLLSRPELVQFAQRVSSDFHLGLLSREDVPAYIDHRLMVAGASTLIFSDDACDQIYSATRGTPRLINILCETCLIYGYAKDSLLIDAVVVDRVIQDKRQYGVFGGIG